MIKRNVTADSARTTESRIDLRWGTRRARDELRWFIRTSPLVLGPAAERSRFEFTAIA
jgi:hypothetical protein